MTRTEVLRSLRLKGRAGTADIAEAAGVAEADAQEILEQSAEKGMANHRTGRRGGWMLTQQGRDEVATLLAEERSTLDTSGAASHYDGEFLKLNKEFKELCTRWQLAGGDAAAAADVQADFAAIHDRNSELLTALTESIPRFDRYRPRFDAAFTRFRDGETAALVQPLSGSYHDVWIELHEDLLLLLDRAREEDD
ncbi:hypothetical protein [Amycolatopsis nigrescens]|uniref:hypothetical protein n=1 Tax=Amycolatopsis nigrescens TaxID=381445 RepID=UPI00035E5CD0|nr:hypothetical protein [Amycolatopsis nigrescens]